MIIAMSAVAIATVVVRQQLFVSDVDTSPVRNIDLRKSVFVPKWKDIAERGLWIGPKNAPVTLIEFVDYQCPFCKSLDLDLRKLRSEYPTDIALVLMHYPLRSHRQAEMAARVVECANAQQRFEHIHHLLFDKQDSIGVKDWSSFAADAGVRDVTTFETCRRDPQAKPRIQDGMESGRSIGVRGTPAVILNGYLLARPPAEHELRDSIRAALARRQLQSQSQ